MANIEIKADPSWKIPIKTFGPLYKAFANRVEGIIVESFQAETAPYGGSWPALSPEYQAYKTSYGNRRRRRGSRNRRGRPKAGGGLKLRWTGSLYDSMYARVDGNGVIAGSNLKVGAYSLAGIHNFGAPRRSIPPRQFFPVDGGTGEPMPELVDELRELTIDYLNL